MSKTLSPNLAQRNGAGHSKKCGQTEGLRTGGTAHRNHNIFQILAEKGINYAI